MKQYESKLRNELKIYTVEDYFQCKETRTILEEDWKHSFYEKLKDRIYDLFYKYKTECEMDVNSVLFYGADSRHVHDLLGLVEHHVIKKYNVKLFEEHPTYALPFLEDVYHYTSDQR